MGIKTGGGSTGPFTSPRVPRRSREPADADVHLQPGQLQPRTGRVRDAHRLQHLARAGHKSNLSGTFYIHGGGATDAVDINGVTIGGDTTIIAESAPIDAFGGTGVADANSTDKVLVLVSYYQPAPGSACTDNGGNPADCAVGIKNNFQPNNNTATLIYAPNGPVAFKNNAEFDGAVYANDIVLKNNLHVVYDPRVDQIVGFRPGTLQTESPGARRPESPQRTGAGARL